MGCAIVPPYILAALERHPDRGVAEAATLSLALTRDLRAARTLPPTLLAQPVTPKPQPEHRLVYDCAHATTLPGRLVRREGAARTPDPDVDCAYTAAGTTHDFYARVFKRNSIDDRGMHLISSVHYGKRYDNAFWDGAQMVYGDGDGTVFTSFTGCLDVIAHELTHGVTQVEADLVYFGESGALNESLSDVFGSLVKQWSLHQTVHEADWLIGAGIFAPHIKGFALRSLGAPGSAYDDPLLGGRDPQPAHMRDYVHDRGDDGEVHVNSGIPNHAFYRFARSLGGHAWHTAGRIWYDALRSGLDPHCDFATFAHATLAAAHRHGAPVVEALHLAWHTVGVLPRVAARV